MHQSGHAVTDASPSGLVERRGEGDDDRVAEGEAGIDDQPQRRREWSGPWRSIVLPVLTVAAIAGGIFLLQTREGGSVVTESGVTALGPLPLPIDKHPPGARVDAVEGRFAPDFILQSIDGGTLRLSDLRGRPVVLNFWATWCGPCRTEIPEFQAVYEQLEATGVVVVAVNVQESSAKVRAWTAQFGVSFPVVLDTNGSVTREYLGRSTLPTTVFIAADGTVASIAHGQLDRRGILDELTTLLAREPHG
jgi:peroxiredoxin